MTQTERLNQPFKPLQSLFKINHIYSDPFDEQQARGLLRIAWIAALASLLYIPSVFFGNVEPSRLPGYVVGGAIAMLAMLGVIVLINGGHLSTASITFVGLLLVAAVLAILRYTSNPLGVNLMALSLPVVATGVLLNRRSMAIMLGLIALSLLGINIANLLGLFTGLALTTLNPTEELWLNAIYFLVDAGLLTVFAGGQFLLLRRNVALTRNLQNSTNLTQTLAELTSVDDLLQQAVELIRDQFGYYYAQAFIAEEATGLLVLRAATGVSYSREDRGQRRIAPDDPSILNEVIATGYTGQLVQVAASDPATRRSEFLPATQFELLVPMVRGGKVLGVLDVQSISADFDVNEVKIIQAIAAQLAGAIQTALLFEALQEANAARDQALGQLREMTREYEQVSREASNYGWSRYLRARPESSLGFDWHGGTLTTNTAISPALEQALSGAMPEIKIQDGKQVLTVPIVLRGQVLGAMEFQSPPKKVWNNRSLELARVIAQRLALALDNIRLYEQAQTIADRERIANQVSARLQTQTDIDSLVALAAESFQQALGATRTNIRMGTPDRTLRDE